jgi:hypothetical protein
MGVVKVVGRIRWEKAKGGKQRRTDDVRAVLERADHVSRHAERVVHDEWDLVLVSDLG